ncbi:MAG: hypothetical protein J1F31_01105 [Erysipelotrichales bacterium]|nr:hypothetical protein [Erysipelotrichales bacterium]
MNKKSIFLPVIAILLTGCNILSTNTSHSNPSHNDNNSTSNVENSGGHNNTDNSTPNLEGGYYKANQVKYTMRDVNEKVGWNTLNSTENQKILVVPVQLSGGTTWSSKMLTNLEKVFFGKSSDTSWRSVSSFFDESSYGKLHITGEVTEVLKVTNYTVTSLNKLGEEASDVIANLFDKSNIIPTSKRKEYDQDNDGFLDATIFVYSNNYSTSGSSAYWAWCYYTENDNNYNAPVVNNYMWASYSFMEDGYDTSYAPTGLDAHTYIHETGHLLGLDDYYCYDETRPWDCAGDRDMQSYNIGDHNIYSKLALGWINPYVVTDSCEINLRSSALYDDAILIKDNWNGSVFDEYLLIEFYTPEGNNSQDSRYAYSSRNKMYDYSGLRIYHVDARLVKYEMDRRGYITSAEYVNDFVNNANCFVGASNSIDYQYLMSKQNPRDYIRYLHLIDKGGKNTLTAGTSSSKNSIKIDASSTLWETGDTFTATSQYFANGNNKFNDGSKVGYSVTVGKIVNGTINVKINKI